MVALPHTPHHASPKRAVRRRSRLLLGCAIALSALALPGCEQPEIKLIVSSISPQAIYLDVSVWREIGTDSNITAEPAFVASNSLKPIELPTNTRDYKIAINLEDNYKYIISVASFSLKSESDPVKTFCLLGVSPPTPVGPFSNSDAYIDTQISLLPVQDIGTTPGTLSPLPESACAAFQADANSSDLAPLISRVTVNSKSILGNVSTQPPPSTATIEGWFLPPMPTVEIYLATDPSKPVVSSATAQIGNRSPSGFSIQLPAEMGREDVRGKDVELRVGASNGKQTIVSTRL